MGSLRMEGDDEEALFNSYACAMYYVQSPSTVSHANSTDGRNPDSSFLSPFNPTINPITTIHSINPTNPTSNAISTVHHSQEASRFTLSRYSSSRGSNNSFLHEKKISFDLRSHGNGIDNCMMIEDDDGGDEEGRYYGDWRDGLFSLGAQKRRRSSASGLWVAFQLLWRLVVSLAIALLVFYLFTRPPPPKMSVKVAGIPQFGLGEGTDSSGVVTKILTSNCSLDLEIENRSKFFGLHVRPPLIDFAFGRLNFATSQGPAIYVDADSLMTVRVSVGTSNRAMYGAGRAMEDMLESGNGLPLIVHVKLRSSIRVVWNLISPRYRHHVDCLLVLSSTYSKRHHTQVYNSTCTTT